MVIKQLFCDSYSKNPSSLTLIMENPITYSYTKKRSEFGKQCIFTDRGTELGECILPDKNISKNFVLRNPVHQYQQCGRFYADHEVNTYRAEYVTSGMNHVEGGWPKDINTADGEATQRYKRKIEKDEAYTQCIMHLSQQMEHYILQNNAINVYQTYFKELEPAPPVERSSCRTINVYRDMNPVKRPVTFLSWSADGGTRLAATHCDLEFQRSPFDQCTHSYIWDIENPNKPQLVIIPHVPLCCLEFNPRDPNTLVGGLLSGQVAAFDSRKGSEPVEMCPMHQAHRDPVRNVLYINSKTGTEFFSSSTDGQCKWWDTRKLSEPTDTMIIDPVKTVGEEQTVTRALGVSCLEYETTIPTRFMCGTEQGLVIGGNRKGKTAIERLPGRYAAHLGPVYSLQRNPGFVKNFLTVGDWTARIWSEDCKESPIIWTYFHRSKLTDGAWSPTRFSMFMTTRWDGCLCCWDILRKQSAPVITAQLCDEPLTKIRPQDQGRLVPCGSIKGSVYLVELSENLGLSAKNDKLLMTNMFERESKRERILEARMREIRLKMKVRGGQKEAPPGGAESAGASDRDIVDAEAEYRQIIDTEKGAQNPPPDPTIGCQTNA